MSDIRLTAPQRRALETLRDLIDAKPEFPGYDRTVNPRAVAQALWPDSPGWDKRSSRRSTPAGGAMGATMPMKAATLLWRLWNYRLVQHDPNRTGSNGWTITEKGREYLNG